MTEQPNEKKSSARQWIEPFLAHLERQVEDRGTMADLRHGFSQATEYRAWPHIASWCRDFRDDRERKIMLTVAAGFALHGKSVAGDNMGAVLRKIASGDGQGADGLSTFDSRFRRLLACSSANEVCEHLIGILRTAERKAIAVDFAQLYEDLTYWGEKKKIEWAKEYWSAPSDTSTSSSSSEEEEE